MSHAAELAHSRLEVLRALSRTLSERRERIANQGPPIRVRRFLAGVREVLPPVQLTLEHTLLNIPLRMLEAFREQYPRIANRTQAGRHFTLRGLNTLEVKHLANRWFHDRTLQAGTA